MLFTNLHLLQTTKFNQISLHFGKTSLKPQMSQVWSANNKLEPNQETKMQITPNAPEDGANAKLEPNQKSKMYISPSYLTNEK